MPDKKILIVEDEIIVANGLKDILEDLDYTVAGIALSGEDAIVLAGEKRPDLILMDIKLQGEMDGVEAAEQIWTRYSIPFIYVTSYSDDKTLLRAKTTTPFGYILKPFTNRDIYTVVEIALYKHEMELKLKESEEKLSTICGIARDAIVMVRNDGSVAFWNPSAQDIFGYTFDEMIGNKLHEYIVTDNSRDDFLRKLVSVNTNPDMVKAAPFEYSAVKKDGSDMPVEITTSSIEIDGEWFAVGIIRDISERKKAERERDTYLQIITSRLKELNCLYRISSFVANPDMDLENIFKNVVKMIPESFSYPEQISARILYGEKEYHEKNFRESPRMISSPIEVSGEKHGSLDVYFLGGDLPEEEDGAAFTEDDSSLIETIAQEMSSVTERRMAEKQLAEYREHLEELVKERTMELIEAKNLAIAASNAKSDFLANMSHELRTPLNSIIGFAKLMKMGYDEEEYAGNLDKILSAGEHLLKLINDILDLSKIEAGETRFESKPVEVHSAIFNCISIVSVQAKKKNIDIEYLPNELRDAKVMCEEKRLHQVFLNLLSNAIKYTGDGGKIEVAVNSDGEFLLVTVKDNGIGIARSDLDRIFDKFSQLKSGLDRGVEGTGLGLTITKKIVEAHGGSVFVDSRVGEGSTFTVTFLLA